MCVSIRQRARQYGCVSNLSQMCLRAHAYVQAPTQAHARRRRHRRRRRPRWYRQHRRCHRLRRGCACTPRRSRAAARACRGRPLRAADGRRQARAHGRSRERTPHQPTAGSRAPSGANAPGSGCTRKGRHLQHPPGVRVRCVRASERVRVRRASACARARACAVCVRTCVHAPAPERSPLTLSESPASPLAVAARLQRPSAPPPRALISAARSSRFTRLARAFARRASCRSRSLPAMRSSRSALLALLPHSCPRSAPMPRRRRRARAPARRPAGVAQAPGHMSRPARGPPPARDAARAPSGVRARPSAHTAPACGALGERRSNAPPARPGPHRLPWLHHTSNTIIKSQLFPQPLPHSYIASMYPRASIFPKARVGASSKAHALARSGFGGMQSAL